MSERDWLRGAIVGFLALGALLNAASCSGDSNSAATTSDAGEDPCWECVSATCASQASACSGQPECAVYFECIRGCAHADSTCQASCQLPASPNATAAQQALDACRASAPCCGANPDAGTDAAPVECPASSLSNQCLRCEAESCCQELDQCGSECLALRSCVTSCLSGDPNITPAECRLQCVPQHPAGLDAYIEAEYCLYFRCVFEQEICASFPDCTQCSYTHCADERKACFTDPECFLFADCVGLCPQNDGGVCFEACRTEHPNGEALFNLQGECAVNNCAVECSGAG